MISEKSFLQKKINKGIQLLKKKKFSDANKIFDYLEKKTSTKIIGLFFLGVIQIQRNNNLFAEKYFFQILELNPNHEDANLNLAFIYFKEKMYGKATVYLDKVIKINKNNLDALYHRGLIYFFLKDFNNAINYFEICINLDNNHIYSYLNLGHIFLRIKEFKKAILNYSKVLDIDTNNNTSKFNLSWCYYALLDFENAFKFYEYRKEKMLPGEKLNDVKNKLVCTEWFGENLNNKTILILSEQGIGDNIQFFRYLFWLKEKFNVNIYFYVDKKISHLFKNTSFKIISNLDNLKHVDYYKLLLSLPGILYSEKKEFYKRISYIKTNDDLDIIWKSKLNLNKKKRIALNWQGDPNFAFDNTRSIPLSFFKEILKINKFDFISLQKGLGKEQIRLCNFTDHIIDLSNEIDNYENAFEDTIAILKNIDLLITSDTAICHLAATLGIKTYLLLEYNPEWRWYIEKEYKCFYPELKIIQQSKPGDWSTVFKDLKNLLVNYK